MGSCTILNLPLTPTAMCSAFYQTAPTKLKDAKMKELEIFDKNGKALHIADVIGSYIIAKSKEMKCDIDQTSVAVDGDKLVITGFYYMHGGEQFGEEIELQFNCL